MKDQSKQPSSANNGSNGLWSGGGTPAMSNGMSGSMGPASGTGSYQGSLLPGMTSIGAGVGPGGSVDGGQLKGGDGTPLPYSSQPMPDTSGNSALAAYMAGGGGRGTNTAQQTQPTPQSVGGGYTTGAYSASGNYPGGNYTPPNPGAIQSGSMPAVSVNNTGPGIQQAIQQASNAAYQNATGYLDPQFSNQQNSLTNSLTNQGIPQGSEAWNRAMDDFQRNKQFAYQQAQSNAYGQGMTAQNQIASQLLQQAGLNTQQNIAGLNAGNVAAGLNLQQNQDLFNNSLAMRNQDINELLMQQQNPLQMYNALTNGTNVQSPNFSAAPGANVNGTDLTSILNAYMGQQNNSYNAQVGAANSANSGVSSIVAAGLMAY